MENFERHAFEEEGKMFPEVRRAFKKDELEDMGTRMEDPTELIRLAGRGTDQGVSPEAVLGPARIE